MLFLLIIIITVIITVIIIVIIIITVIIIIIITAIIMIIIITVIIMIIIIIIQRMWNVKAKVIPVITGATGTVSETFRKYLSSILGKHEIKELQKVALLFSVHIFLKVRKNIQRGK